MSEVKQIELSDGRVAIITPFKGKHVFTAMKEAGTDEGKYLSILIAKTTTIDGNAIVLEDLEEMDGADVLKIMGEFSSNFTSKPATS